MARARPRYHHGALREALVDAAAAVLEREGLAGLTLREVARQAGVSHAAPRHQFPHLEQLLQALAARGHRQLAEALRRGQAAGGLPGLQRASLAFASARPRLFGLMFHPRLAEGAWTEELEAAAAEPFEVLVAALADAQARGEVREGEPRALALAVWATLHGLASLLTGGHAARRGFRRPALELLGQVTAVLGAGLAPPRP